MLQIFHVTIRHLKYAAAVLALIWGSIGTISNSLATNSDMPLQIVGFGDSLMAGYELPQSDSFTVVLQSTLKAKGFDAIIANAGVSGDTTSGGLERLDWSVPDGTKLVILELGANDALRGISPKITRDNLDQMITRLKQRNIAVVLAGMLAPPNMGKDYETAFNAIHPELATKHNVPLIPFFMEGVMGNAQAQLSDRLHPNRKGVDIIVENTLTKLLPEIQRLATNK